MKEESCDKARIINIHIYIEITEKNTEESNKEVQILRLFVNRCVTVAEANAAN